MVRDAHFPYNSQKSGKKILTAPQCRWNQPTVGVLTVKVGVFMKTNEKIRLLRQEHEWSQKDVAEKLQMSVNGYSKIERGESHPNIERLQQIADIFGVSLTELFPSNDGNVMLMINGDNHHGNFYHNGTAAEEIQNLKMLLEQKELSLQHKDELLAQQARELATLQEVLELLKRNLNR